MRIDVITGFPRMLEAPLQESMIQIGRRKNIVNIHLHDLRKYTDDRHQTIDDYPYGGGPGMVLKAEPFLRALRQIFSEVPESEATITLTSPRGQTLQQNLVTELSLKPHLVILCGHYKGVDERLHDFYNIQDISIGDYVLSSGESAALVIVDAVVRLLPGVIKDIASAWSDSFSDDLLDAPYFTRPEELEGRKVPETLLSGDHKKIDEWRQAERERTTAERRPDLYENYLRTIK
jgi:tRNA (guanine37-N1)-methyltransferase